MKRKKILCLFMIFLFVLSALAGCADKSKVGGGERTGIYTNMIRNRIPISRVDFESMKKNPNLFSFGKEYCGKTLGGVV